MSIVTSAECEAILHDRSKVKDFSLEYLKRFARANIELLDIITVRDGQIEVISRERDELAKAAEALAVALGKAGAAVKLMTQIQGGLPIMWKHPDGSTATVTGIDNELVAECQAALAQYKALKGER